MKRAISTLTTNAISRNGWATERRSTVLDGPVTWLVIRRDEDDSDEDYEDDDHEGSESKGNESGRWGSKGLQPTPVDRQLTPTPPLISTGLERTCRVTGA